MASTPGSPPGQPSAAASSVIRDRTAAGKPFLTTVDADAAWPEFRWRRLVGVTFWRLVDTNGQTARRHLERHELDPTGNGIVLQALYEARATTSAEPFP